MGDVTFKASHKGFKEMAISDEIRAVCLAAAEKAKVEAIALAADHVKTGDYEASFNVRSADVTLKTGFGIHAVAAGILENTSEHAAAVEWGNHRRHQPDHILKRTLGMLDHG